MAVEMADNPDGAEIHDSTPYREAIDCSKACEVGVPTRP